MSLKFPDFDLHPALQTFKSLWDKNLASAVHATSIPYTGRSHFDGQNLMQSGGKIPYAVKTGWLGRGMKLAGLTGNGLALSLPVTELVDKYYGDVQEMGGNRWDTSSLIKRFRK